MGPNYFTSSAGLRKPGGILFGTGWQYWNGQEWANDYVLLEAKGIKEVVNRHK